MCTYACRLLRVYLTTHAHIYMHIHLYNASINTITQCQLFMYLFALCHTCLLMHTRTGACKHSHSKSCFTCLCAHTPIYIRLIIHTYLHIQSVKCKLLLVRDEFMLELVIYKWVVTWIWVLTSGLVVVRGLYFDLIWLGSAARLGSACSRTCIFSCTQRIWAQIWIYLDKIDVRT